MAPMLSEATRVAYSVATIRQAQSVREAVGFLIEYLPTLEIDPARDLDLVFQVNRPTRNARGTLINRLARWEAMQLTSVRVVVGGSLPVSPLPSAPPVYAARVYVDVSTDAENTISFTGDDLTAVVRELRAYAIDIAENGDRR